MKRRIFDENGNEVVAQRVSYSGRTTDESFAPARPDGARPDGARPDKARPERADSDRKEARPGRGGERPRGAAGPFGKGPPRGKRPPDENRYGNRQRGDILRRDHRPEREDLPALPVEPPRKYVYRNAGEAAGVSGAKGLDRIAKVMARAGLCSRRDAEDWIRDRRVIVNGAVIESPALDVAPTDRILVDGAPLPVRERTRLWLFHKPTGLVTTESDPEGRPTVFDNLPAGLPRVVSIGRLDINTEGLLLLTNDGGLARVLAHPTTGWLRRYRVRVNGKVASTMIEELRAGVSVDGIDYEPIIATLDRSKGANAWMTLDLSEGKNREVKRVLEHFGLLVTRLIRISFGPFQLGDLAEGEAEEVKSRTLRDQLGDRLAAEAEVDFEAPRFEHDAGEDAPTRPLRKRYDSRKPSEKRALAESGEASGLEVKRERFSTRKGRVVEVERIAARQPSEASLGTGRVLWRRDGRIGDGNQSAPRDGAGTSRAGAREARPDRAEGRGARAPRRDDERRPPRADGEKRRRPAGSAFSDSKSYSGRSTSGKAAGKVAEKPGRDGKPFAGRTFDGKGAGARPAGERTYGSRSSESRSSERSSFGAKSSEAKSSGAKSSGAISSGAKSFGGKTAGGKPSAGRKPGPGARPGGKSGPRG